MLRVYGVAKQPSFAHRFGAHTTWATAPENGVIHRQECLFFNVFHTIGI
jgi:hypothetical protein